MRAKSPEAAKTSGRRARESGTDLPLLLAASTEAVHGWTPETGAQKRFGSAPKRPPSATTSGVWETLKQKYGSPATSNLEYKMRSGTNTFNIDLNTGIEAGGREAVIHFFFCCVRRHDETEHSMPRGLFAGRVAGGDRHHRRAGSDCSCLPCSEPGATLAAMLPRQPTISGTDAAGKRSTTAPPAIKCLILYRPASTRTTTRRPMPAE